MSIGIVLNNLFLRKYLNFIDKLKNHQIAELTNWQIDTFPNVNQKTIKFELKIKFLFLHTIFSSVTLTNRQIDKLNYEIKSRKYR